MKVMNARRNLHGLAQVVAVLAAVNVGIGVADAPVARAEPSKAIRIVAFGDSLTAGFGLRPRHAFPAQLQKVLKSRGHNVVIANAGVSGDTTTAGLERLAWAVPDGTDAVIVEFGGNDALRGIDPEVTRAKLEKIISNLKERNIPTCLPAFARRPTGATATRKPSTLFSPLWLKSTGSFSINSSLKAWCSIQN